MMNNETYTAWDVNALSGEQHQLNGQTGSLAATPINQQFEEANHHSHAMLDGPVLWLQPYPDLAPQSEWLKRQLRALGLEVTAVVLPSCVARVRPDLALILIRVSEQTHHWAARTLFQVRMCSHTPVVLLTDSEDLDWSLTMLNAGADAVIAHDIPEKVMLAHCLALLRRWRPAAERYANQMIF